MEEPSNKIIAGISLAPSNTLTNDQTTLTAHKQDNNEEAEQEGSDEDDDDGFEGEPECSNHEIAEKSSDHEVAEKVSDHEVAEKSSDHEVAVKVSDHEVAEKSSEHEVAEAKRSYKLSNLERQLIAEKLLLNYTNGKLKHGIQCIVAAQFRCTRQTVYNIWNIAKNQINSNQPIDVKTKLKGNSGRKRKNIDLSRMLSLPLESRGSIRSLSEGLGISKSTCHRLIKSGEIRTHICH